MRQGVSAGSEREWGRIRFDQGWKFGLAAADWLSLLRDLGYATPPTLQGLAGQAMTLAPAWSAAEAKMREARRYLSLGEDRQALSAAYALLDTIAANPYKADWGQVLGDPELPAEKAEVLRRLLQAQASVLSKLGRHPAWHNTNPGDRQMLPVDHWEAELAIALSQLLLAAAERWRSIKDAHDRDQG